MSRPCASVLSPTRVKEGEYANENFNQSYRHQCSQHLFLPNKQSGLHMAREQGRGELGSKGHEVVDCGAMHFI
jgi:hypothetical protein